jgi:hypothetical protein
MNFPDYDFQDQVPATQLTPIVAIIRTLVTPELGVFPALNSDIFGIAMKCCTAPSH